MHSKNIHYIYTDGDNIYGPQLYKQNYFEDLKMLQIYTSKLRSWQVEKSTPQIKPKWNNLLCTPAVKSKWDSTKQSSFQEHSSMQDFMQQWCCAIAHQHFVILFYFCLQTLLTDQQKVCFTNWHSSCSRLNMTI